MKGRFWKNRVFRIVSCLMALTTVVSVSGCSDKNGTSDGTQSESEAKETFAFVYDLNYEGARNRTITITAGKKASNYNPSRFGFVFEGWFCEKECKTPYDFSKSVNKDTTIYASWTDESTIDYHNVTFDYGDGIVSVEKCRDGKTISLNLVKQSQKFGYDISGWYLDPEFTQEFAVTSTPVTNDITLYAKYQYSSGIKFTEDGDFDFENVEITISFRDNHDTSAKKWVQTLLDEFNELYSGKISVSIVGKSENGTLIYNSTSALNEKQADMYAMEDVLSLVGKDFDTNEYYANWINDCYIDGKLYSMPIGAFVPVIGYSRSLMDKYNDGALPTDHETLMALLKRVHEGESGKSDWQSTVSMSLSWDMKEVVSNNFYVQNGLELYSADADGKLSNQWLKDETTKQKALNATNWFRDMFIKDGSMGKMKGYAWSSGKSGVDWTWVGNGKSFMGIMGTPNMNSHFGWRTNQTEKTLWTKTVGAMPISYFFATEGNEETSSRIFVQNYSLAIPKLVESDTTEVAAAAIFADFASKYCEDSCESYLYPANKVAQYNAFNSLDRHWSVDYLLAECGDPNDFYTYPGKTYEYNVISSIQSSFLMTDLCWIDDDASNDVVMKKIEALCEKINGKVGVR